jgi:hypothetical protein
LWVAAELMSFDAEIIVGDFAIVVVEFMAVKLLAFHFLMILRPCLVIFINSKKKSVDQSKLRPPNASCKIEAI